MLTRRGLIGALLAPAVITTPGILMPVRPIPKPFLVCDGSEISKSLYPELYKVLGGWHGACKDRDKFRLPDLTPPPYHLNSVEHQIEMVITTDYCAQPNVPVGGIYHFFRHSDA